MRNLSMQIRRLDDVPVDNPQRTYASTGDVRRGRTAQPSGPNDEDLGGFESFLACAASDDQSATS